jgi:hypothetical protein
LPSCSLRPIAVLGGYASHIILAQWMLVATGVGLMGFSWLVVPRRRQRAFLESRAGRGKDQQVGQRPDRRFGAWGNGNDRQRSTNVNLETKSGAHQGNYFVTRARCSDNTIS